jgi:hypothetical protein
VACFPIVFVTIETMEDSDETARMTFLRGETGGGGRHTKQYEEEDGDEYFDVRADGSSNPLMNYLGTRRKRPESRTPTASKKSRSRGGGGGGGGDDPASDDDDVSSIDTLPPPPPPQVSDIALREDHFAQCMSMACGFCSLSLTECFHTRPPIDCTRFETYRRYLHPSAFTALQETNAWIVKITKGAKRIQDCIAARTDSLLFTATARVVGEYMRKHIMDGPLKNAHTRVASAILDRDIRLALEELYDQLKTESKTKPMNITYDYSIRHSFVQTEF